MIIQGSGPAIYQQLPPLAKASLSEDKAQLPFFNPDDLNQSNFTFFMDIDEASGLIRGVIKLQASIFATPTHPFMGINYVSTRESLRGQGVASRLLTTVFAAYQGQYLLGTEFSAAGRHLKSRCCRLARDHQVFWVDHDLLRTLGESSFPTSVAELHKLY